MIIAMSLEDMTRKWQDAFNRHDVNEVVSVYSTDTVVYDPAFPEPLKGHEGVRKDVENFFGGFPDVKVQILNLMTKGDVILGKVLFTGTNSGPLGTAKGTVPATNRQIEFRSAFSARANSQNLLVEERRYFDTRSLLRSLGLIT